VQTEVDNSYLNENQVNLACFSMKDRLYALDVSQVREIVRFQEATPLPMAPALIDGVIDLRGVVIPVLDLGHLLGEERTSQTDDARIVVLDCDGMVLGLCVEAATDVLSLDASELGDVPDLATQAGYDAVRHVVRRPGGAPVMVLSLEHILENVYRSALPTQQGDGQ
jgi:purine-binding chemotaxis protein CheW